MFDTSQSVIEFLEAVLQNDFIDYAGQYGEPGYSQPEGKTPMVVLGSYWCRCDKIGEPYGDGSYLHGMEAHYPAAFRKLEEQGVQFEWYDEWMVDYHHDKAYRTSADSYSWQPSVVWTDDDYLTPDDDIETWIEWVANEPTRCLPDIAYSGADLIRAGFEQYNSQSFQNGWYAGQNDRPEDVLEQIRQYHDEEEWPEVVFTLDRTGQFDLAFSAYYRTAEERENALGVTV